MPLALIQVTSSYSVLEQSPEGVVRTVASSLDRDAALRVVVQKMDAHPDYTYFLQEESRFACEGELDD